MEEVHALFCLELFICEVVVEEELEAFLVFLDDGVVEGCQTVFVFVV